jgi:hypothetical protein
VELNYDKFVGRKVADSLKNPFFSDVLSSTLCKESRMRAWCNETRAYETVVQKKSIGSLPGILALQCSCAGGDPASMCVASHPFTPLSPRALTELILCARSVWKGQNEAGGTWLPDVIEIECLADGSVSVAERVVDAEGNKKTWYLSEKGERSEKPPAPPGRERAASIESNQSNTSSVYVDSDLACLGGG